MSYWIMETLLGAIVHNDALSIKTLSDEIKKTKRHKN